MSAFIKANTIEVRPTDDVFLTRDYFLRGDKTIVTGDDYRAGMLLARKGDVIPSKLAKFLAIDENTEVAETIRQAPKVVSPEEIASRRTRPEKPTLER